MAAQALRQGDAAAEQALLVTLAAREAEAGPETLRVAEVLDRLAASAEVRAPERAASYLGRALAIRRAKTGPDDPEVSRTLTKLGSALLEACRLADAELALREALAMVERTAGPSSAMVTEPLEMLSDARWEAADDTGSEQLLLRAASVLEPLEPTEWKRLVRVLGELVENDLKRKNFAAAVVHGERRVSVAERRLGAGSPVLTRAADALATAYRAQKNEGAALALFQRLSLVERVLPLGSAPSTPLTDTTPAPRPQRCTTAGERGSVSGFTPPEGGGATIVVPISFFPR